MDFGGPRAHGDRPGGPPTKTHFGRKGIDKLGGSGMPDPYGIQLGRKGIDLFRNSLRRPGLSDFSPRGSGRQ